MPRPCPLPLLPGPPSGSCFLPPLPCPPLCGPLCACLLWMPWSTVGGACGPIAHALPCPPPMSPPLLMRLLPASGTIFTMLSWPSPSPLGSLALTTPSSRPVGARSLFKLPPPSLPPPSRNLLFPFAFLFFCLSPASPVPQPCFLPQPWPLPFCPRPARLPGVGAAHGATAACPTRAWGARVVSHVLA